ncbi:MAG: AbrB/MazE/SpoVT family DNA-binding domain-containing protein [Nitrospirae bacterium]|nr:MAG: AbrB/MazE/SpoVT family DNA-binding domain-containing protein [Nitrospirota bacterium]
MKTTIDRFGRIVVPKEMRRRFGLAPGAQVEVDEQGESIVIRQAETRSPLKTEDGLLVFDGEAGGDLSSWLSKVREDRNAKLMTGV